MSDPPKRKRRWFQFSLRSLMIFTLTRLPYGRDRMCRSCTALTATLSSLYHRCYLMNPSPERVAIVHEIGIADPIPVEFDRKNGECLIFAAVADHQYRVEPQ
jgi:hypothetical protein